MSVSDELFETIQQIRDPLHIYISPSKKQLHLFLDTQIKPGDKLPKDLNLIGYLPALFPEWLGSVGFLKTHRVRFPYVVGEMSRTTPQMIIEAAKAGLLGFFDVRDLSLSEIEGQLHQIYSYLGTEVSWGSTLVGTLEDKQFEEALIHLYLRYGIRRVSVSGYTRLTIAMVEYACTGLTTDLQGEIKRQNHILAKVACPRLAKQFMQPAPKSFVDNLLQKGRITQEEAELAMHIPMAQDITVQADSSGYTQSPSLTSLFPTVMHLAEKMTTIHQYRNPISVGAAGDLGTPNAIAASFNLGAAYIVTSTINQATVESGLSNTEKEKLVTVGLEPEINTLSTDELNQTTISSNQNSQMNYGPTIGAFNTWVANSFLASLSERTVSQIALNLLEGAAVTLRAQQLRAFGLNIPNEAFNYRPKFLS